ncbi:hypothetical protein SDC9_169261 [bioreactor metagenome]|uniref:Uncharacterized protein n=1 Tax=bioreactor metagenome TaxID=1076179 RepID=A0A645G7W3_9ZZZZ
MNRIGKRDGSVVVCQRHDLHGLVVRAGGDLGVGIVVRYRVDKDFLLSGIGQELFIAVVIEHVQRRRYVLVNRERIVVRNGSIVYVVNDKAKLIRIRQPAGILYGNGDSR